MQFDLSRTLRYAAVDSALSAGYAAIAAQLPQLAISTTQSAGLMAMHAVIANLVEQVSKPLFRNFFEDAHRHDDTTARIQSQYVFSQLVAAVGVTLLLGVTIEKVLLLWVATRVVDSALNYYVLSIRTSRFTEKLQVQEA